MYYMQTNAQVKCYRKTILLWLRLYVDDNQRSWDIFVQHLTYAYIFQLSCSDNVSQFSLTLTQYLHGLVNLDRPAVLPTEPFTKKTQRALRARLLDQLTTMSLKMYGILGLFQRSYKTDWPNNSSGAEIFNLKIRIQPYPAIVHYNSVEQWWSI